MTENEKHDFRESVRIALRDIETGAVSDSPNLMLQGLTVLLGGALLDLRRVADAVEKLSKFEIQRVGDILVGGVPGMETLTPDERETIEALRRGDIKVVMAGTTPGRTMGERPEPDADEIERTAIELYRMACEKERQGLKSPPWVALPEPTRRMFLTEAKQRLTA